MVSSGPRMLDLDLIVSASLELAPLPATVQRLSELMHDKEIDLRRIAQIVALDEALTGRILRTANSALYATKLPCKTVRAAVVRLGSGVTLSYALGGGVRNSLSRAIPEYGLEEGALWRHSVAAAFAAELIRQAVRKVHVPEEAYAAALLHDIGKLVLARFLPRDLREPLARARGRAIPLIEAETLVLGVHHGELGEVIARKWRLPPTITLPIRHYHKPTEATELLAGTNDGSVASIVCDVVHLADAVAHVAHPDDCGDERGGEFDIAAANRLGLDTDDFERITKKTQYKFEETLALYG